METKGIRGLLFSLVLLSGCASIQTAGEVQRGRYALLYGDPKVALTHFQRAAELNPEYILNFSLLDEGVWTYMGRSYYAMANLAQARKVLDRARSRYDDDHLAKLYLGLALARDGNRAKGLREIRAGLKGLNNWLDYIHFYVHDGQYWDPGGRLQKEIEKDLKMIEGGDLDLPQLLASVEWLGREFEHEVDLSERDKYLFEHDGGDSKAE